ncbi:hydroxyacylglutathione hydrolase cytoplasmic isoform X2 [Quercus robur]|uniref:hydroxyacylglutathione hydrolase cytoplasmic isoform X2 n=1 Tax=Quercus robur TaxID=38942 RepID=UPI002161B9BC|nr:hydroxyacylglutathione hydrolase cytoplasmic isoform X2 [Quercus robur]
MKVYHVPCLEDNYSYLIIDERSKEAAVVDPVEAEKVVQFAKQHGVLLKFVLTTHHHCHTNGHISYYVTSKEEEDPAVFTGDTLFIAGCGKFFEGTAEQMYQSLCVTLGSLPKPTRVYCGHEYTVKNLQFALTVEPDNVKIQQKLTWAQHQRQAGLATIPSTIEEELETNPFMRVDLPEIQARVGCGSPVEAIQEIRKRKDNWRG